MAGRIKDEDVTLVKEKASIEAVVREHVTLTRAGAGRMKGLCPFHDEKTPSFTIRPAVGHWHCFGCNEGGDVITFVQKVDHLSFVEAVERLAAGCGVALRYEEGGGPREHHGRRGRLVEAHRVAEEFYHGELLQSHDARLGRDFLRARGFDSSSAARFGVGYAPRGGEDLVAHLLDKGFDADEIVLAGLVGRGSRGLYDRFRGRLVWPIRDITGDTVGFGARRLFDEDRIAAKYLNTAETPIYKKTSLLYGLDLAKKPIATTRRAVVVEGYTDVMACHLAGVEGAVATCGTAFGPDHVAMLRRILRDDGSAAPARTVFTFDGDVAGQKAAMKAFDLDQKWASQCYVAVADSGMDPCELRQQNGDDAVRALVDDAVPMFEFAVRTTLARYQLGTAEGRVQGMRAVAPIIAGIRDRALRPEYTRTVAGWIGVQVEQLASEVARGGQARRPKPAREPIEQPEGSTLLPRPDRSDPNVELAHQFLQVLLQYPNAFSAEEIAHVDPVAFRAPAHRAVFEGVRFALDAGSGDNPLGWVDAVNAGCPQPAETLVSDLVMAPLKARLDESGAPESRYVQDLYVRILEGPLQSRIVDASSALQRAEHDDPQAAHDIALRLYDLQRQRLALRERVE